MAEIVEIQQLAFRYALAVDSRNLEGLASLFVEDVRAGQQVGREALRRWYDRALSTVDTTIHVVANHIVEFDPADSARAAGVVYCREEVRPAGGEDWWTGMILYRDHYRRCTGSWLFQDRRVGRWYRKDESGARRYPAADGAGPGPSEVALPRAFTQWGDLFDD